MLIVVVAVMAMVVLSVLMVLQDVLMAQAYQPSANQRSAISVLTPYPYNAEDTIKIASFNIQVFGRSKASKPEAMEVLASITSQFDIVAIQEIKNKSCEIKNLTYCLSQMNRFNADLLLF